jgi:uncharacterized membrane protein
MDITVFAFLSLLLSFLIGFFVVFPFNKPFIRAMAAIKAASEKLAQHPGKFRSKEMRDHIQREVARSQTESDVTNLKKLGMIGGIISLTLYILIMLLFLPYLAAYELVTF